MSFYDERNLEKTWEFSNLSFINSKIQILGNFLALAVFLIFLFFLSLSEQISSVECGTEPYYYYIFGKGHIDLYDMRNTTKSIGTIKGKTKCFIFAVFLIMQIFKERYTSYCWDAESNTLALGDYAGFVKLYDGKSLNVTGSIMRVFDSSSNINIIFPLLTLNLS